MPETDTPTTFTEWLKEHRRGALDDELAAALADVVLAVRHNGKKGRLKIDITIERKGRNVVITDDINITIPQPDREAAIYFDDESGLLHRDDPKQGRLPLNTVENDNGGLSVVDTETGELRRVEGDKQ